MKMDVPIVHDHASDTMNGDSRDANEINHQNNWGLYGCLRFRISCDGVQL